MSALPPSSVHPEPADQFVGFALFSGAAPAVDALAEALGAEFGSLQAVTVPTEDGPEVPALVVDAQGATVLVVPTDGPVPDENAVRAMHPVWWQDADASAEHANHVVITTLRPPEVPAEHDVLLAEALGLAMVATLTLELPGAVGLFYGNGGVTFPAAAYVQLVRESLDAGQLPTDAWVSAWLMREPDDKVGGTTVGLSSFGHAELLVTGSEHDPSEVYGLLSNLGGQLAATGQHLDPDSTIGPSEDEQYPVTAVADAQAGGLLRIAF